MEKFAVLVEGESIHYPVASESEAIAEAKEMATKYPQSQVLIEYFRTTDGFSGYLNKDGYSITGESWT